MSPNAPVQVERVLSAEECLAFIAGAEKRGFAPAMFGGNAIYDLRRSAKVFRVGVRQRVSLSCALGDTSFQVNIVDADWASNVFQRIERFLPPRWVDERGAEWLLYRLHPKLNVLRYGAGEYFHPHRDGGGSSFFFAVFSADVTPQVRWAQSKVAVWKRAGSPRCMPCLPLALLFSHTLPLSFSPFLASFVVRIYLNDGAVDGCEEADFDFAGGALSFLSTHERRLDAATAGSATAVLAGEEVGKPIGAERVRITPQAGSVVVSAALCSQRNVVLVCSPNQLNRFEHGLLHEGEPVTSGRKYAIR